MDCPILMGDTELRTDQFEKLAKLLDSAITRKELMHLHDLRLAAVLIFSLIRKGYCFKDCELEKIMGKQYSKFIKKELKNITWVCNELVEGLNDDDRATGRYNLKYWKTKKKHHIIRN